MRPVTAAVFFAISIGCAVSSARATDVGADAANRNWQFTVLLDGRRIGEHDFSLVRRGDETVIDSEAHFRVRAAFIPLYHYDHRDHEVWRRGCLAIISSRTQDDGNLSTVEGVMQGAGFHVQGSRGPQTLPACIQTYAYWDAALLEQSRLLNSQTGEYQPTTLTRGGTQDIAVGARRVAAQRVCLTAPKLAIQLSYSPAGEWLALESKLASGRTLRYEIKQP
jgi:Family of unknown function (DUF6134)